MPDFWQEQLSFMDQITLPGVLGSLRPMSEFLSQASHEAGLDKRAANRLHVAVDELVTNIIMHGYDEQGLSGEVTLLRVITPETLAITVEDSAPPFDPRDQMPPTHLDNDVEERMVGGVGIYLMLRMLSAYSYEFSQGKNRSTLIMNRAPSEDLP